MYRVGLPTSSNILPSVTGRPTICSNTLPGVPGRSTTSSNTLPGVPDRSTTNSNMLPGVPGRSTTSLNTLPDGRSTTSSNILPSVPGRSTTSPKHFQVYLLGLPPVRTYCQVYRVGLPPVKTYCQVYRIGLPPVSRKCTFCSFWWRKFEVNKTFIFVIVTGWICSRDLGASLWRPSQRPCASACPSFTSASGESCANFELSRDQCVTRRLFAYLVVCSTAFSEHAKKNYPLSLEAADSNTSELVEGINS